MATKKNVKSTKSAVTKKTVKKVAKKKDSNKAKKESITTSQAKVLKALKGTKVGSRELNRKQLEQKTGISNGWAKLLGALKDGYGAQGGGLAGMGLIRISKHEDSRQLSYSITARGNQVLTALGK